MEYVHSIMMSLVGVSFQLWNQKLSMYLVSFLSEEKKWWNKFMNIKQMILGFHFFYATLIIRFTKVYYW